jgi:putative transposase
VIYTTNAIESVNMTLRKVTRNHRIFRSDDAVYNVLYLAIQNITKKWSRSVFDWKAALNYFSIAFAERFPQ